MSTRIFIIDTGYLSELFRVPNKSSVEAHQAVYAKFLEAIEREDILVVPLPCLFELSNHIANAADGKVRRDIIGSLTAAVKTSVANSNPWIITPYEGLDALPALFESYLNNRVASQISFTDSTVLDVANIFKNKYNGGEYFIHVWTKDSTIKAFEPDTEANQFVTR